MLCTDVEHFLGFCNTPDKSVSEIAYGLGFKYPQHFTRAFKQCVGYTPNEYKTMN
ncbi:helix-turn-helix domain-containing protein [Pedobacter sp. P351]|uniref:helix-turn-helix domain-containing protein n=1 Tax=Pedobacter superstes TaxID=3133441 RepID=UPI0030978B8F